ncbi:MAG TPA: type II toxin-antitoxin system RelE/ParE family toxin [Prolixibacteraceae bacterium]|jgi:plasmid stabilization system protein ParE|nr:type II toxin-antitoxin system RelE/ParE family toxin [Prolixibacteraceae bacterium]
MKRIVWTPEAVKTYHSLVQYLALEWGNLSKTKFLNEVELVVDLISRNPRMFKRSTRYENIRIGYLSKQCSLIYRIKPDEIELLLFWGNRQDSKKLKY